MLIIPYGDTALLVKAGEDISLDANALVRKMVCLLDRNPVKGVTSLVPSYNELLIHYDPMHLSFNDLLDKVYGIQRDIPQLTLPEGTLVEIPVSYGGDTGPDLVEVAKINGISEQEVIQIHSGVDYYVYMLGFAPGFCYLGGMDGRIATPRKEKPRLKVTAGSVGIAGNQTGIYPIESPGGWQIIGHTNVKLFDQQRDRPFLVEPGDKVRFVVIT